MHVNNVADVLISGKWINSWVGWEGTEKFQYNTRASIKRHWALKRERI